MEKSSLAEGERRMYPFTHLGSHKFAPSTEAMLKTARNSVDLRRQYEERVQQVTDEERLRLIEMLGQSRPVDLNTLARMLAEEVVKVRTRNRELILG